MLTFKVLLIFSFFDRHTHVINRVRFSPKTVKTKDNYTKVQLASCSSDHAVKLFEVVLEI